MSAAYLPIRGDQSAEKRDEYKESTFAPRDRIEYNHSPLVFFGVVPKTFLNKRKMKNVAGEDMRGRKSSNNVLRDDNAVILKNADDIRSPIMNDESIDGSGVILYLSLKRWRRAKKSLTVSQRVQKMLRHNLKDLSQYARLLRRKMQLLRWIGCFAQTADEERVIIIVD